MMAPLPIDPTSNTSRGDQKQSNLISYALDIENFFGYQEAMLEKTIGLMQHVWLRGALLITKKFKVMRPKEQLNQLN
jgi:hypothetical protein